MLFFHWLGALLLQVDHTIGLQHFEFWPHIGPFGAKKGHFVPKRAFFGPLGVQKGAQYQPKICGNHDSNPVGPIGGSWDQIWPPGALWVPLGPHKGTFWAKIGPFGVPEGPEEAKACGY